MGGSEGFSPARGVAVQIVRTLREAGHEAYFAGGCVRDELLDLEPTDYDVATDATPDRVRGLFDRTHEVGAAFGVVLVAMRGVSIEVATFRSDGPYADRRRPDSVHFSDARADAERRDFTVNALFLDPLAVGTGEEPERIPRDRGDLRRAVIDHVGGLADLDRRVIRAVGEPERRLGEDHLRALRAVRLAARLGFEIDPGTSAAIRRHAIDLEGVSRERIGDEIRRMMDHATRSRAVDLLCEHGLDRPVLREGESLRGSTVLERLGANADLASCLAAWALDRGLEPEANGEAARDLVRRWRSALCLSNAERDRLLELLRILGAIHPDGTWSGLGVAAQKRLAAREAFADAVDVLGAWAPESDRVVRDRVRHLEQTPSGLSPEPLVTGEDLLAAGLEAGPRFAALLERVYDAQLEDRIRTRDQAMELIADLNV